MIDKKPFIIAEAGNNHEGNLLYARELIMSAKECGCDAIKFQAGHACDFARKFDQIKFYEKYEFKFDDYRSLIEFGKAKDIPVFFSIWSSEFLPLYELEEYHKIAARQFNLATARKHDRANTFISVPLWFNEYDWLKFENAIPFHCITEYPTVDPKLWVIDVMRQYYSHVGYSDHTIGIQACIDAVYNHKACVVEKHFTLDKNTKGIRDHVLSADPDDMSRLVKEFK